MYLVFVPNGEVHCHGDTSVPIIKFEAMRLGSKGSEGLKEEGRVGRSGAKYTVHQTQVYV